MSKEKGWRGEAEIVSVVLRWGDTWGGGVWKGGEGHCFKQELSLDLTEVVHDVSHHDPLGQTVPLITTPVP